MTNYQKLAEKEAYLKAHYKIFAHVITLVILLGMLKLHSDLLKKLQWYKAISTDEK